MQHTASYSGDFFISVPCKNLMVSLGIHVYGEFVVIGTVRTADTGSSLLYFHKGFTYLQHVNHSGDAVLEHYEMLI